MRPDFRLRVRLAIVCAATLLATLAPAQTWPTKPVRLVVTFPPGGANDIIARMMAQALSDRLGQAFVIDNRVGAGGNVGAQEVVRAAPDGHTLLQATVANATNASLYENMPFNFLRDIAPVGGLYQVPLIFIASPALPVKTVPEFIAYAKANPGKINYGSGGVGSMAHIAGELFKSMTGTSMVHVPYRGSPPALMDLLNSRLDAHFDPLPTSLEYARTGALRGLAVTSASRSPALPDLPTLGEFLPGFEASVWVGLAAPKATPGDITGKLSREMNAVLADPAFRARLATIGAEAWSTSPEQLGKRMADDTEKWAKVIKAAGIKAE